MSPEGPDLILVGKVVKPHGLHGEVLVRVLTETSSRFDAGTSLLMGDDPQACRPVTIVESRAHKGGRLVRFEGVSTVDDAQSLRERMLFVDADAVPRQADQDAYWLHEVVGLEVRHRDGTRLGRVAEVLLRPAQDLWLVDTGRGEVMFPAARQLVDLVDLEEGVAVVNPPEGLFFP